MAAAFLFVSSLPTISTITSSNPNSCPNFSTSIKFRPSLPATSSRWPRRHFSPIAALQLISHETLTIDKFSLNVAEAFSEDELWAASCLRVRSFYDFQPSSFGIEFSDDGEDRVVVGTLDLNQCIRLPDEIAGKKPEGIGADFARAYVSNVCVAEELQRNGLGFALVAKSKIVAEEWGISDLYVHVAVDNEPAKQLYLKSGFVYESDEPAWQARFLDRPRRILLWAGIPHTYDL